MERYKQSLRVDLWLYHCRFFKSRSLATAAVNAGHVRLNGQRASPGTRVNLNDRIELLRDRLPYALNVIANPGRRGPAKEARVCYEEDEMIAHQRRRQIQVLKQDRLLTPKTAGRPDKHTRRELIKRRQDS